MGDYDDQGGERHSAGPGIQGDLSTPDLSEEQVALTAGEAAWPRDYKPLAVG